MAQIRLILALAFRFKTLKPSKVVPCSLESGGGLSACQCPRYKCDDRVLPLEPFSPRRARPGPGPHNKHLLCHARIARGQINRLRFPASRGLSARWALRNGSNSKDSQSSVHVEGNRAFPGTWPFPHENDRVTGQVQVDVVLPWWDF